MRLTNGVRKQNQGKTQSADCYYATMICEDGG